MRRAVLPRSSGMALALLAMLLLAGCDDRLPPLPNPTGVTPATGQVDQSVALQISGTDFGVRVFTDFTDPSQSRTDDTYQVTVGGVALTGVQHVDATELTGTLPAGVPQGNDDLQVTDPWGRTVTLAAAYFGLPAGGFPTQLALLGPANVPIGACQAVTVEQRNAAGAPTVNLSPATVALDTVPAAAFGVFGDSSCTTAITSATIDPGQTQVVVYVSAPDRVSASLRAASTGLTTATHPFVFGPTQLAFTNAPITANANVCVATAVTLETRNPAGAASAVAAPTTITLGVSSSLALYAASGCTGATVTSITIPAGGSSASFYIKGLAGGTYTITASSTGYLNATQAETITVNNSFLFKSIGPQGVQAPFPVTIEVQDPFGAPVPGFTGTATLSGLGGTGITCVFNCGTATATTAFTLGGWSGWVSATQPVSAAAIHAVSGTTTGDSSAFAVLAPDAGFAPTARLTARPGAVSATGDVVVLDARLSSDYGQGAMEYSFDPTGTAGTDAGTAPWTIWGTATTYNASGYTTGLWQPRVAVRKSGGSVFAYASATVVATGSTLCTVTTTSMVDDGASNCSMTNKYGTDGAISLPEAIALTNGAAGRAITTNSALRLVFDPAHPVPAVTNGTALSFASGTQLVGIPLSLSGAGALVANAEISGTGAWTVSGGDLTVQDVVLREQAGLTASVPLSLRRVLAFNCLPGAPCASAVGPNGALQVLFSQFLNAPGDAIRVAPATPGGLCPAVAMDVQSSTFTRTGTAIHDDCDSGSRIVHATFHANGTGVLYGAGGAGNTLENSVFSANTTATSCGTATFTARDYNLLSGNGADGCAAGDPNTLTGDPQYFLPEAGDFRDRATSPARDSAFDLGLDVNDVAPGNFFNAGPDRGGRETP